MHLLVTDSIGSLLCERILTVLFDVWIFSCARCFPAPSLWKTLQEMCSSWRHHDALVAQWHRVNVAFTTRLLHNIYGTTPQLPTLQGSLLSIQQIFHISVTFLYGEISWFESIYEIVTARKTAKTGLSCSSIENCLGDKIKTVWVESSDGAVGTSCIHVFLDKVLILAIWDTALWQVMIWCVCYSNVMLYILGLICAYFMPVYVVSFFMDC